MKIAILGAAGAIGKSTLPELLARGHTVRLVGRDQARLDAMAAGRPAVETVAADLEDPAAARRAVAGVDAVLFAVGLPYHEFARYPRLTQTVVDAAAAEGVDRFLQISTLYPYGRAQTPTVDETHARLPHTRKGAARLAQAEIVRNAHDPLGMRTLELVLPDFYGATAEYSYSKEIFEALRAGRTANVIGPVDVPHEYVYVPDAAVAVAELFGRPDLFGERYHFGGTGTITTRQFITIAERLGAKRIKTLVANKTLLRLLGLFNPLMAELVEMHYLFTEPVILNDRKLRTAIPHLPRTSYEDGIAQTLALMRAQPKEPAYV